jgi:hypothetical protein
MLHKTPRCFNVNAGKNPFQAQTLLPSMLLLLLLSFFSFFWVCFCLTLTRRYIIPFFIAAEMGLAAQARSFQVFNDLPASLSVADIAACKAFRFKPPVLSVKLVSVSLRGAAKPEPELEARPWNDL